MPRGIGIIPSSQKSGPSKDSSSILCGPPWLLELLPTISPVPTPSILKFVKNPRPPFPPNRLKTLAFALEKPSIFTFLRRVKIYIYMYIHKRKKKTNHYLIKRYVTRYEMRDTFSAKRTREIYRLSFIEAKGMANKSWKMESRLLPSNVYRIQ